MIAPSSFAPDGNTPHRSLVLLPSIQTELAAYPCASSAPYALLLCFGTNLNSSPTFPKNISLILTQSPLNGLLNNVSSSLRPLKAGGRSFM